MDIYKENLLDHANNPRHFGRLENPTHHSQEENVSCGDDISLYLEVVDDVIAQVGFEGNGCVLARAAASLITEKIQGLSLVEAKKMSKDDVFVLIGGEPSPARLKCALLPLEALRSALSSPS